MGVDVLELSVPADIPQTFLYRQTYPAYGSGNNKWRANNVLKPYQWATTLPTDMVRALERRKLPAQQIARNNAVVHFARAVSRFHANAVAQTLFVHELFGVTIMAIKAHAGI